MRAIIFPYSWVQGRDCRPRGGWPGAYERRQGADLGTGLVQSSHLHPWVFLWSKCLGYVTSFSVPHRAWKDVRIWVEHSHWRFSLQTYRGPLCVGKSDVPVGFPLYTIIPQFLSLLCLDSESERIWTHPLGVILWLRFDNYSNFLLPTTFIYVETAEQTKCSESLWVISAAEWTQPWSSASLPQFTLADWPIMHLSKKSILNAISIPKENLLIWGRMRVTVPGMRSVYSETNHALPKHAGVKSLPDGVLSFLLQVMSAIWIKKFKRCWRTILLLTTEGKFSSPRVHCGWFLVPLSMPTSENEVCDWFHTHKDWKARAVLLRASSGALVTTCVWCPVLVLKWWSLSLILLPP